MTRREYAGAAPPTELAAGIVAGGLSFTVAAGGGSGYPTGAVGPFFVVLDEATGDEEKILCSSRTGDVFTVAGSGRGADDTTDVAHTLPCTVRHIYTATDADEANAHVNTGAAVHGATGNIVGDSDAQTLTNKIISGASNTFSNIPQSAVTNLAADQATQDSRLTSLEAADVSHAADTSTHGVGVVVGTTEVQTLTNKTIDGDVNTLSNIPVLGISGLLHAFKTADETITSSTTLQNDDALIAVGLDAGTYLVEATILWEAHETPDIKFTYDVTLGTIGDSRFMVISTRESALSPSFIITAFQAGGVVAVPGNGLGSIMAMKITGFVILTGGSNNFRFQWAQNTSSASATRVKAGSWMRMTKVA
jgi:hypothetical protein